MADQPAPAAIGVRDLLRIPDFRRLYLAQAISDIGDGMTYLALFLLVLDLTGSTAAIALMSILVALPPVTVGLFAGAWADRHDRRRIMLASDSLRADRRARRWSFAAIARGRSRSCSRSPASRRSSAPSSRPARMAMLPRVVPAEGLLVANSLGQATRMVASVIGGGGDRRDRRRWPGVVWPVLVVDAATFLVSVVLVLRRDPRARAPDAVAVAKAKTQGLGGAVADGPAHHRPLARGSSPRSAACRS